MWKWTLAGLAMAAVLWTGRSLVSADGKDEEFPPNANPSSNRRLDLLRWLMGGIWIVGYMMVLNGVVIISPELGTIMVRGTLAFWTVASLMVLAGLCSALLCHVASDRAGIRSLPLSIWIVLGLAVGVVSAAGFSVLNGEDPSAIHVYSYFLSCWGFACPWGGRRSAFMESVRRQSPGWFPEYSWPESACSV